MDSATTDSAKAQPARERRSGPVRLDANDGGQAVVCSQGGDRFIVEISRAVSHIEVGEEAESFSRAVFEEIAQMREFVSHWVGSNLRGRVAMVFGAVENEVMILRAVSADGSFSSGLSESLENLDDELSERHPRFDIIVKQDPGSYDRMQSLRQQPGRIFYDEIERRVDRVADGSVSA